MQTTGLFSSSSPQQANVGGGSSLIGTLGAALVLVFGVVLLTGLSLDRTQTAMVRFLAEKGVALVTALESGVRSGTRSRTGIRLQYLVEELADRPDVRFIAVTMPDGTILAHSNPARVGEVLNTRGGRELGAETIAALRPSETPSWAIIDMEGSRAFVVFKTFHPKVKGEGRQDEPMVGPLPYVFLGLDLAPLEVAQAQNRERAVLLGAGVLLAGMLAFKIMKPTDRPQFITYAISICICCIMCPVMSLIATVLFKEPSFGTWIRTWAMNFPMAICYQMFYCGPFVRLIFRLIFRRGEEK